MRDLNPNAVGRPDDPKATRGSTWRPRAKDEDIITNNDEGAPCRSASLATVSKAATATARWVDSRLRQTGRSERPFPTRLQGRASFQIPFPLRHGRV